MCIMEVMKFYSVKRILKKNIKRSLEVRRGPGDGHRRSSEVVGGPVRWSEFIVMSHLLCSKLRKMVRVV